MKHTFLLKEILQVLELSQQKIRLSLHRIKNNEQVKLHDVTGPHSSNMVRNNFDTLPKTSEHTNEEYENFVTIHIGTAAL